MTLWATKQMLEFIVDIMNRDGVILWEAVERINRFLGEVGHLAHQLLTFLVLHFVGCAIDDRFS